MSSASKSSYRDIWLQPKLLPVTPVAWALGKQGVKPFGSPSRIEASPTPTPGAEAGSGKSSRTARLNRTEYAQTSAAKNKGGGTPRRRGRQAKPQHKNIDRHRPSPTPATFSLAANDSAKCILYGFSQGRFPKRSISPRRNSRLASPPQTSKSFRTCLRADMT